MKWLLVIALLVTHCVTAEPLALIDTGCTTSARTSCTGGKLDIPKAADMVALCPTPTNCWAEAVPQVKRFDQVLPTEWIDGCDNPALARGTPLPQPWTAATDPCKTWRSWPASTFKSGPTIVVSPNGAAISWAAPTSNTDGTPITGSIKYEVFRGFLDASGQKLIIDDPSKPLVKVADTTATSVLVTRQPAGIRCYAVRAVVGNDASLLSNAACKTMTIPAPSDGSITSPTDGSIK